MALTIFIKVLLLTSLIAVALGGGSGSGSGSGKGSGSGSGSGSADPFPCKDTMKWGCSSWKRAGYCEKSSLYFTYVAKRCCKTCGVHVCDREDNGGCAQVCEPDGPGRECTCEPEFKLSKDGKGCELKHAGDYKHHIGPVELATCVNNTNSYRRKHADTDDMEWDEDLATEATEYANYLMAKTAAQGYLFFKHASYSARNGAGENLYAGYGRSNTCANANKAWYSEIKDWDFSRSTWNMGKSFYNIGHFTQLVWKGTTKFALGIAIEEKVHSPLVIVVGRYSPAGNYNNAYEDNIGCLKGSADCKWQMKKREVKN